MITIEETNALLPCGGNSKASAVITLRFAELATSASDPRDGFLFWLFFFLPNFMPWELSVAFPYFLAVGEVGMGKILCPGPSSSHNSYPARADGGQGIALGIAIPVKTEQTSRVLLLLGMMCNQAESLVTLEISCKCEFSGLLFICPCTLSGHLTLSF